MIETASFKCGRFDEVGLTYGMQIFCTGINLVFFQVVEKLPYLTERFEVTTFFWWPLIVIIFRLIFYKVFKPTKSSG